MTTPLRQGYRPNGGWYLRADGQDENLVDLLKGLNQDPVRVDFAPNAKTGFGELATAETTPEVQISAVNGLREDVQQVFAGTGAGITETDGNYEVTTGTDPFGFASLLTRRPATYRNGQGLIARYTALFPSNAANNIQVAGMINSEDAWGFGYNGTEYGLVRAYGGVNEYQLLAVSAGAEADCSISWIEDP